MIGDAADFYRRLILNIPKWFGEEYPVLDALLQGYIIGSVFAYSQIEYVKTQTRIKTATGDNLDLISKDFLGDLLPRRGTASGLPENDDTYRAKLLATILQERATRYGIYSSLLILTGYPPLIFEPWKASDTGGYRVYQVMGYGTAGKYGSGSRKYQGWIDVYIPKYQGMALYNGYRNITTQFGGYGLSNGVASMWYGSESLITKIIKPEDVYQIINITKVFGTICWVAIHQTGT